MWRLALSLVGLTACYRPQAKPGAPCNAELQCPTGQTCAVDMVPPTCTSNTAGDASTLDDGDGVVVDAPTVCGTEGICSGATPVCGTIGCRRCDADTECASNACNESTGACFAENTVVYVAHGGDDLGSCTRLRPCATISTGATRLGGPRVTIAVAAGTYHDSVLFTTGNYTLSGASIDATATHVIFAVVNAQPHLVEIRGMRLFVEGFLFTDTTDDGVRVQDGGTLVMVNSEVDGSDGNGVDALSSEVDLSGVGLYGNTHAGLHATSGSVDLDACYISNNTLEGVSLGGASYAIVNSVIASNNRGGIAISGPSPTLARFDFNTVFDNAGTTNAGMRSALALTATNSIFVSNGATPQVAATIATSYDLFDDMAPPGIGNVTGSPDFVDPNNGDLHIKFTSAGRDLADPNAGVDHDFDFERRPHGPRSDIGCDEHY